MKNKLLAGLLAVAISSPALAIDDFSRGAVVGVAVFPTYGSVGV